jgi:sterol desaturase/sphingolipid hydroxylase (fatty acid hydroxylase superfamily)
MMCGAVHLASGYALAVNVPYALAVVLVAGEVVWLVRRPGPVRSATLASARTAAAMGAGAFVIGFAYTVALRRAWELVASVRWEPAARFWSAHPAAGAVATFVAWDLTGWLYHLIGHRTSWGWAAHQAHHSGAQYDATLALRQTWAPFHGLLLQPVLALAGFEMRVAFVCAAVSNAWQMVEHTSLDIRLPRCVEAVVMTPAAHRHHHGRNGGAVNLGPFFTLWDRAAGTWVSPAAPPPLAYGPADDAPRSAVAVELSGFRYLVVGLTSRKAAVATK